MLDVFSEDLHWMDYFFSCSKKFIESGHLVLRKKTKTLEHGMLENLEKGFATEVTN